MWFGAIMAKVTLFVNIFMKRTTRSSQVSVFILLHDGVSAEVSFCMVDCAMGILASPDNKALLPDFYKNNPEPADRPP
jgi:hypothetical protein